MHIYDLKCEETKTDISGITVKSGQKVVIVRLLTISYTVDVKDLLDDCDVTEISLKQLITGEERENDITVKMEYWDEAEIGDDLVISAEVL